MYAVRTITSLECLNFYYGIEYYCRWNFILCIKNPIQIYKCLLGIPFGCSTLKNF